MKELAIGSPVLSGADAERVRRELLLEVSDAIVSHRQLSSLLADLSRLLRRLVAFDYISVVLCDSAHQTARLHLLEAVGPMEAQLGRVLPLDQSPLSVVFETQRPIYLPEVEQETRFPVVRNLLLSNGIHSYCMLPLSTAQRALGGLGFGTRTSDAYSAGDIEFMGQVARQVSVAVDNALNAEAAQQYEQQLAKERDRLRLLLEVNNAVVTHLEMKPLFQAISTCLRNALEVEYASLALFDAEAGKLRLRALDFPLGQGRIREGALLDLETTPAGTVYSTGKPRVFSNEEVLSLSPETAALLLSEGLRCVCVVPLISRQKTLGTLNLGSAREDYFAPEDVSLLSQVASQIAIALDNAISYQHIEELNIRLAEEKIYLEDEISSESQFEEIIGQSRSFKAVLRQVKTVAPTEATVLISGETGTGKELLARSIHKLSPRGESTFVKLNCAAIPTGLLESELFGHEKGAFTGAISQRIGRFELANHGTIFLDEVSEIPLDLQTKLLRVLQEREFERLGSSRTLRTEVRLVAATNRDLARMVEESKFRADLYYRLNVFPIQVPPLRARRDDIPLLVQYFTQQFARRMHKRITTIPAGVMRTLAQYPWPGNIRELQNVIERAVILSPGTILRVPIEELPHVSRTSAVRTATMEEAEREAILRALRDSAGRVGGPNGAAVKLGMKRTTLQARMRKLGIVTKVAY
jgi:formate hydrogenlyase transcriptional activator